MYKIKLTPGDVLHDLHEDRIILVGTVNILMGYCDDCSLRGEQTIYLGNVFSDPSLLVKITDHDAGYEMELLDYKTDMTDEP